jgi:hypothetical protein
MESITPSMVYQCRSYRIMRWRIALASHCRTKQGMHCFEHVHRLRPSSRNRFFFCCFLRRYAHFQAPLRFHPETVYHHVGWSCFMTGRPASPGTPGHKLSNPNRSFILSFPRRESGDAPEIDSIVGKGLRPPVLVDWPNHTCTPLNRDCPSVATAYFTPEWLSDTRWRIIFLHL